MLTCDICHHRIPNEGAINPFSGYFFEQVDSFPDIKNLCQDCLDSIREARSRVAEAHGALENLELDAFIRGFYSSWGNTEADGQQPLTAKELGVDEAA